MPRVIVVPIELGPPIPYNPGGRSWKTTSPPGAFETCPSVSNPPKPTCRLGELTESQAASACLTCPSSEPKLSPGA